ncbi:hypothetical protein ACQ4PT_046297 [Festuca glaucescens]
MGEKQVESAPGAGVGEECNLDEMLQHLELRDDELEDVVLGAAAVEEFRKEARWLAIGRVMTSRSFSTGALFEKMKAVWNLSREPRCREVGENLFIFQMHCLGDWKKVVQQGPWTFRGWGVLIEDYDGLIDPEKFTFGGMYAWAQIHGIPELYQKEVVVDDLARRVGKTKEVQMAPKLFYEGNYVRIRVIIDVSKPLMPFVSLSITGEGRKRLAVKYEKISYFCKSYGLLGHDHEECGDGVWEEKDMQYEEEIVDSASSPIKTNIDEDLEDLDNTTSAQKKLDMNAAGNLGGGPMDNTTCSRPDEVHPPPPSYEKPHGRNKQRKVTQKDDELATSVASSEEDR